jgi:hypothetical protein
VDGEDQSVIGGNFMWTKKANAYCELFKAGDNEDVFTGWHDGYKRLKDPVLHRREIRYLKREDRIIVTDTLDCRGDHTVERFWHFSEHCRVTLRRGTVIAINDGIEVRLEVPDDNGEVTLHWGDDQIPLGWVSRRFDVKTPTVTAVWRNSIRETSRLTTVIALKR